MYTGHIAVALAAERHRRRVPLLALLLVAQAPDWIEQFLTAVGQGDRAQLWSHSLPAVFVGIAIIVGAYMALMRDARGSGLLALVYLSHPALDLVTGSKPLWPGGPALGACLYNRPAVDWLIECAVLLLGWIVYRGALGARSRNRFVPLMLAGLLACQTIVDAWQAFRIYRAPDLVSQCNDTSPSASGTAVARPEMAAALAAVGLQRP